MNPLQTASLTDMSTCQQRVIAMTHQGPVALLYCGCNQNRSFSPSENSGFDSEQRIEDEHVAGVLISLDQWKAIAKTLVAAKECIAAFDANAGTR